MALMSTKYFVNIIFTTNTTNIKFSFSVNQKGSFTLTMQPLYKINQISSKGVLRYKVITTGKKISCMTLTWLPVNQLGSSYLYGQPLYQLWQIWSKRGKKLRTEFYTNTTCFTLTFNIVTQKSIVNIYSLGTITVPNLAILKQRGQKIFSVHHLVYRPIDRLHDRHVQNNLPFFKKVIDITFLANKLL